MTEHGGGRDSDRNSADSWFRPSQNRHRIQSEYQDPLDEQREEDDQGAVFPDSGGYAGLGSARPEMVEPYPEALSGFTPAEPQTPLVPEEPAPSTPYESQNPFMYPGAREAPQRPVEPMPWEDHGDGPGGYPNVAASADVPPPPVEEGPTEWPSTGSVDQDASSAAADSWSPDGTVPETDHWPSSEAWTSGRDDRPTADPWSPLSEPSSWNTSEAGPVGTGPPSSDRESWASSSESSSWDVPGVDPLGPGGSSSDRESWSSSSESSSWDVPGVDPLGPGGSSSDRESWSSSSESSSWDVPGTDPLGPGAPAPVDGEHWPSADNVPSWGSSSEESPLGSGAPTGGFGSWDTPGTDPLGSGTATPGEPWVPSGEPSSWDAPGSGGAGGGDTSDPLDHRDRPAYGDDGYNDELSGTAGPGTWTPGDRTSFEGGWNTGNERSWADDGYDDELSGTRPPEPDRSSGLGTGSGNTWAFSRDDPRLPDAVRQAEQRRREDTDRGVRHDDWGGPENTGRGPGPVSEDPLATLAGLEARPGSDEGSGTVPPADGGATQMFGASPVGDDQGASTQMFSPLSPDGLGEDTGRPPAGVPSDLGSVPSYGNGSDEGRWEDGYDDGHDGGQDDEYGGYEDEYDDRSEDEYEDGFTPADYGMPEKPRRVQRRRLDITEDFPGFDDRPPGGEPGDGYPGYDSVDFLADTEPGANHTLWLGVASLIPFVGVITALLALLVTGPKAKREIQESRGELDGHGRIMTGTVFAVIGIVVTVISLAIVLIL